LDREAMSRRTDVLVASALLLVVSKQARADGDVTVTRDPGTQSCPNASTLQRLAAAARAPLAQPTHRYRVTFQRASGYRAEIVDETAHRSRRVQDESPGCGPLGQAVAVVLATMWGSEGEEAAAPAAAAPPASTSTATSTPTPTPTETSAPTATTTPTPSPPPPPSPPPSPEKTVDEAPIPADVWSRPAPPPRWMLRAGAALAEGIVRPAAPAFLVDGAFESGHASVALGALWIPPQRIALSPGEVDVQLFSGALGACLSMWERTRLGVCGRFLVGEILAAGSGFSVDSKATRPWFAAGPELFVDGLLFAPHVRYRASVAALVPVHAEAFYVAGPGVAYDTPPFGGLFTLAVELGTR
jgi:hypothetical protein